MPRRGLEPGRFFGDPVLLARNNMYMILNLHTATDNEDNAWWMVDLQTTEDVAFVRILNRDSMYSLCQKKRTFNSEFFRGPPGGGGPKIHMVDFYPASPRGATKKFGIKCAFLLTQTVKLITVDVVYFIDAIK